MVFLNESFSLKTIFLTFFFQNILFYSHLLYYFIYFNIINATYSYNSVYYLIFITLQTLEWRYNNSHNAQFSRYFFYECTKCTK